MSHGELTPKSYEMILNTHFFGLTYVLGFAEPGISGL
jgi:hypothetical protein